MKGQNRDNIFNFLQKIYSILSNTILRQSLILAPYRGKSLIKKTISPLYHLTGEKTMAGKILVIGATW